MARPNEADGTGLVITFGTSSWGGTGVDFFDVKWNDVSRGEIDTTNYASTARTNMPTKLTDPGTITMTANWNSDQPPPYTATAELVTILSPTYGTATGTTGTSSATPGGEAVQAWVKKFSKAYPIGNRMEATIELRCTGLITKYAGT